MPAIYILGIFAVSAYLLQCLFGFIQIKHFTKVYGKLRQIGRVVIGRKSGKIRAGTIVMFAIDSEGIILEGQKIQGTTVLAKFKVMEGFKNQKITELNETLACVKKENKPTRQTIEEAVQTYKKVTQGEAIVEKKAPFSQIMIQLTYAKIILQNKFKRSVDK